MESGGRWTVGFLGGGDPLLDASRISKPRWSRVPLAARYEEKKKGSFVEKKVFAEKKEGVVSSTQPLPIRFELWITFG